MPEAIPDIDPTVATEVLVLIHVPPEVASVSVVGVPGHACSVPDIAAGFGCTVSTLVV
jgi:hypothetical protein